jgi:hypothetical protein
LAQYFGYGIFPGVFHELPFILAMLFMVARQAISQLV